MANEWVKVELYGANNDGTPRRYTIADGVSCSQGAILQLLDDRTASYSTVLNAPIAGIAAEEHVGGESITDISCWTQGIFRAVASGGITVGDPVIADRENLVRTIGGGGGAPVAVASYAAVFGRALDTATDGETLSVRVNL